MDVSPDAASAVTQADPRPISPPQVWMSLSPTQQHDFVRTLALICQEVLAAPAAQLRKEGPDE